MIHRRHDAASSGTTCPHCSSTNQREQHYSDEIQFKTLYLDVEGLLRQECLNCHNTWVADAQATHNGARTKNAFEAKRNDIRERDGLLTGEQILDIRKSLRLNQRQAAAIFGGGSNAFNKYESGEVLQSFAMDRLLRLTYHVGDYAISFLRNVGEEAFPSSLVLKIEGVSPNDGELQKLLYRDVCSRFDYETEPSVTQEQQFVTHMHLDSIRSVIGSTINMEFVQNDYQPSH